MQKNYRHSKDVLKYSAVYKRRRKIRIVKLSVFGFLFLCILIGAILILRTSFFSISEIQVKGLQSAGTQEIIDKVNADIGGNYALVIPKRNIFFYPKSKIKNDLLAKYSTFADVQIGTVDVNKLEISITEKSATIVGCQNELAILDKSYANCFFLDSSARAFQPVNGEPDQSLLRVVDFYVNTGSSTLNSKTINQIQSVKSDLSSKNLETQYVKIVDAKSVEFQIVGNGKIMVSTPVNDDLISILNTALNTKPLADNAKFEYVDVRFGNKVFFKLQNGKASSPLSLISSTSSLSSNSASTTGGTMTISTSNATSSPKTLIKTTSTSTKVKVIKKKR